MKLLKISAALALLATASCNKHSSEADAGVDPNPKVEGEQVAASQNTKPETTSEAEAPFVEDIDAARAGELVKLQQPPVVLDVRTPEEFAAGHIEGAINVDFNADNFKDEVAKLDPEKTYLLHCRSGGRSSAAKPVLTEAGFKHIYHLDGGMMAWEEAGLPTVK